LLAMDVAAILIRAVGGADPGPGIGAMAIRKRP
jgi:hypothetical protein